MPFHVHVAEEGAVHASVHGHGGGGVCGHGVSPPLRTVGGTGHWALRGGCEDQGILTSEPKQEKKGKKRTQTSLFHDQFAHACRSFKEVFLFIYLIVSRMLGAGIKTFAGSRTWISWPTGLQSEGRRKMESEREEHRKKISSLHIFILILKTSSGQFTHSAHKPPGAVCVARLAVNQIKEHPLGCKSTTPLDEEVHQYSWNITRNMARC